MTISATRSPASSRRNFLGHLGLVSGAAVVGGVAVPAAARARAQDRPRTLDLDVAIYIDRFVMTPAPGSAPPAAGYGTSFIVEGEIFEAGTLDGEGIDTGSAAIAERYLGTWFCRGWFVNTLDRPNPHIISHQDFLLDRDLMTPDTIVTSGVEGNEDPAAVFHRAVTGGTGRFAGVTGETIYRSTGTNARLGANLRYHFDFTAPTRTP